RATATPAGTGVRVPAPHARVAVVSGAHGPVAFGCGSGGGGGGVPSTRPLLAVLGGAGVDGACGRGPCRRRCRAAPPAAPGAERRPPRSIGGGRLPRCRGGVDRPVRPTHPVAVRPLQLGHRPS